MTASLLIPPVAKFWNIDGAPLASGKVYTYAAGTVSTPKASYTDFSANTSNTNPVHLDSNGEANIWLDGNYKINVTDSNDVQLPNYPVDNVSSFSASNDFYVTTGSANAYILSPAPSLLSYAAGVTYNIEVNANNTGPSTINISNLGTKNLVIGPNTPLIANNLTTGIIYNIVYDGTNFQVLNPSTVSTLAPIFIQMSAEPTPPTGYLPMDASTIAKTSGGTYNGTIYERLYTYLWTNYTDTAAPVSTGRGVSAAVDFAANKNIGIPDRRGYSPMGVKAATSIAIASDIAGALTAVSTGNIAVTVNPITLVQNNLPALISLTQTAVGQVDDTVTGSVKVAASASGARSLTYALTNSGGGQSFTPTTATQTYTGNATSVLQPSFGVYYYINY